MPKGVDFSNSATLLLPPPAKSPPPRARDDGPDSFQSALKKAQPQPQPDSASASSKTRETRDAQAKTPTKPAQKPKRAADDDSDTPDTDQSADPGAQKADANSTSPDSTADQAGEDDKPVKEPSDTSKPANTEHASDADAQAQQIAIVVPAANPKPQAASDVTEKSLSPAQTQLAPVQPKTTAEPIEQADPTETDAAQQPKAAKPGAAKVKIAIPRQANAKEADDTDEVSDDVADETSTPAQVAKFSDSATKNIAPVATKQRQSSDADTPEPDSASAPKLASPKPKPAAQTDAQPLPDAQAVQDAPDSDADPHHDSAAPAPDATALIDAPAPKAAPQASSVAQAAPAQPPVRPEQDFATANHDRIVSAVRTELLPNGGTMHLRLDPPDLGPLQVSVHMADGAMTASFETSSDQATRLLSHSLGQLKTALETQGVSVERLHVEQAPREQQSSTGDQDQQRRDTQQQQDGTRRDQQRREMLNRMWQRMSLGRDPLDMVA